MANSSCSLEWSSYIMMIIIVVHLHPTDGIHSASIEEIDGEIHMEVDQKD